MPADSRFDTSLLIDESIYKYCSSCDVSLSPTPVFPRKMVRPSPVLPCLTLLLLRLARSLFPRCCYSSCCCWCFACILCGWQVELERDVQVSLTHHMTVIRSIEVSLGKVHCAVHVDFWIDVQASPPSPSLACPLFLPFYPLLFRSKDGS